MMSEDPTTQQELLGWYSYAWAAEPFLVSAVGTYVPILLEQFARENGVRVDDHLSPCAGSSRFNDNPGAFPPTNPGLPGIPDTDTQCVVKLFGVYIDTSSFALYTFSISVLVQTLVVISMSGAADRGKFRKKLLVWFAIIGSIATMLFITVTVSHYYVASLLAIISNAAFGAVSVCGNAYLPVLVNNFDNIQEAETIVNEGPSPLQESERLIGGDLSEELDRDAGSESSAHRSPSKHSALIEISKLSNRISGIGVATGYLSALLVQILTILIVLSTKSTTFSLQIAVFFVGVWWFLFQVPVLLFLRSRPGPPLPESHHPSESKGPIHRAFMFMTNGGYAYVIYGWKTLFATFREARKMRDVGLFLIGWFLISDAATTINSTAVLFARSELQMSAPSLAVVGVLTVFSGIFGATMVPRYIQPRLPGQSSINAILFVVCIAAVIPAYGVLGFYTKALGLTHPWEMYGLAIWYGFALGGLNTTCRSLFSMLIPKGKETTFFSLFSVTDKGSSIVGPLVTGLITDKTHNIRYTFYFLLVLMILPMIFFHSLDIDRGNEEAKYLETVEVEE